MISETYYKDKFYADYKNASLAELEFASKRNIIYGGDGKGRLCEVALIKDQVLSKLIKIRKDNI